MGPKTTSQPRRALVMLRDGRNYECMAWVVDGLIHASAVRRRIGDESFRELGDRTWPQSRLSEIRWLEADQELAA